MVEFRDALVADGAMLRPRGNKSGTDVAVVFELILFDKSHFSLV